MSLTLLHLASLLGAEEVTTLLIERKASLDLRDSNGCTALIAACSRGYSRIACRLLEAGADPSICSKSGHTPLPLCRCLR